MGQINLFASTLTDTMTDDHGFMGGKLYKVSIARYIDERQNPHAYAFDDSLEYNYIMAEVAAPLTWDDFNWLYGRIVGGDGDFNKSTAWRYSIERTLNAPGARQLRRKVESDSEWARVKEFRRILEAPALAFMHFKRTFTEKPGQYLEVHKVGKVLVIEYASDVTEPVDTDEELSSVDGDFTTDN
jgi:hypothetical protein